MDFLDADVAAVFRTVIKADQGQIQQAVNYWDYDSRHDLYRKKDGDDRNLLHYVCMYNTDEVATWMLSPRTGFNIPRDSDKFGVTAVMYAARAGMVTFVTEWIKQKYGITTVDKDGRNILHYCCGEGEIIPYIPEARRRFSNKIYLQQLACMLVGLGVSFEENVQGIDFREKMQNKNIIDLSFDECWKLNADRALKMWKVGREANRKIFSNEKYSPGKEWEVIGGLMHVCVAECFIKNVTPSSKQRIAMFEERIKTCKPSPNEVDDNGMTALHYLCYYEFDSEPYGLREVLVGKLLELEADPNIKDIKGYTPLMCAVDKGYKDVVKFLQENVQDSSCMENPHSETDGKRKREDVSQKISKQRRS